MFNRSNVGTRLTFIAVVCLAMSAAGCGSSGPAGPSGPSGGSLVTVFIAGDRGAQSFSPNPLTVRVGQMVNFKNNDTIVHNATVNGGFSSGDIPPLSAHDDPVMMTSAGTLTYHCTIHPGMVGTIVVQP